MVIPVGRCGFDMVRAGLLIPIEVLASQFADIATMTAFHSIDAVPANHFGVSHGCFVSFAF